MKIRPVGVELFHTDGQTDVIALRVTSCNFANVPKRVAKSDGLQNGVIWLGVRGQAVLSAAMNLRVP